MATKESRTEKRDRLTPEVVRLTRMGWSQSKVAKELGVSTSTVGNWLRVAREPAQRTRLLPSVTLPERIALGSGARDPSTGCIPWMRGRDKDGYGRVCLPGAATDVKAHRAVLAMKLGRELGPSEVARHTCDNPPCVNPDHLQVGSVADNSKDMVDRGRAHPTVLFNTPERRACRACRAKALAMVDSGASQTAAARAVGVSQAAVSSWLLRRRAENE